MGIACKLIQIQMGWYYAPPLMATALLPCKMGVAKRPPINTTKQDILPPCQGNPKLANVGCKEKLAGM